MSFTLGATLILLFSIYGLCYGLHADTKFTKTPPVTTSVAVNGSVTFTWEFEFGNDQDWVNFDEFVWGTVDSGHIANKYITVSGSSMSDIKFNPSLPRSLLGRITYSGSISSSGCTLNFQILDVQTSDGEVSYGCDVDIAGEERISQPFHLTVS